MSVSMFWIALAEASPGNIESAVADWPYLIGMLAIVSMEFLVSRYFQRDCSMTSRA